jgi:hypothetical protein
MDIKGTFGCLFYYRWQEADKKQAISTKSMSSSGDNSRKTSYTACALKSSALGLVFLKPVLNGPIAQLVRASDS